MSPSDDLPGDAVAPAERALLQLVGPLRHRTPDVPPRFVRTLVRRARVQRLLRHPLRVVGAVAGGLATAGAVLMARRAR